MDTIGRNDPCPCGSGKKYKKCHGAVTVQDPRQTYDKIRRLEGTATDALLNFAVKRYGDEAFPRAWSVYHLGGGLLSDLLDPEQDSFVRWITFNWQPEGKETLAELFLRQKSRVVESGMKDVIEATLRHPYSFHQITDVTPGESMVLRDILLKEELRVHERSASQMAHRGDILYGRVVELYGVWFLMGCGARVIPASDMDRIITFREALEAAAAPHEAGAAGPVTAEVLLRRENDLRALYFEIEEALTHRRLEIRNTDGEPLEFHTLTYTIPSLEEAFDALKDLEQKITRASDEEILSALEEDEPGKERELVLTWMRTGFKGGIGETTSLATLHLRDSTMTVEVNSEKRSKRIQKEIKKRMGDAALLVKEETKSHEGLMADLEHRKERPEPSVEEEQERMLNELPEVQAMMREMMEKHWAAWPDTPVPALRNMTPHQAARDATGRELLESLLLEFELRNKTQENPLLLVDIEKLRRDLGLNEA